MNDDDKAALMALARSLAQSLKISRHLGSVDETCPHCGGPIETLLNQNGTHPRRCCWACEAQALEQEIHHD